MNRRSPAIAGSRRIVQVGVVSIQKLAPTRDDWKSRAVASLITIINDSPSAKLAMGA